MEERINRIFLVSPPKLFGRGEVSESFMQTYFVNHPTLIHRYVDNITKTTTISKFNYF